MAEGLNQPPAPLRLKPDDSSADAGVRPSLTSGEAERRGGGPPPSPHAGRFRTATAVLVGLAVAAIVVAVAVGITGRGKSGGAAKWSPWSPPDRGLTGAREIADFLAPFYRATPADQLSVVTVVNLESAAAQAAAAQAAANGTTAGASSSGLQVAVRPNSTSTQVTPLTGNTIAYDLCGTGGKDCTIAVGKPSSDRLLLLKREALELALYTFKYIGGTQNVVAILPPGYSQAVSATGKTAAKTPAQAAKTKSSGAKSSTTKSAAKPQLVDIAVLFNRQEVAPLLSHPLLATLPETVPPTVAQMARSPEAELVDEVAARGLFSEQLQQSQDGSNLIVLNPLPPQ